MLAQRRIFSTVPTANTVEPPKRNESFHAIDETELNAYVDWIKSKLRDDKDVKDLLPRILNTQNDNPNRTDGKIDLFEALKSGILLVKLINDAIPGAIDESLIIPNPKIAVHMYENHSIVLETAKRYGLQLWNIGPQDIMRGVPHLCLGLVWQIIKIGLFKKADLERKKMGLTEKSLNALPAEELVLRWFNDILQITNKTSKRVAQWSLDLRDSVCYTIVLQYLGSIAKEEFHGQSANFIPEEEQDWLKRAERMLSMAEKLGCRKFLTPVDVVNGNKNLNIAFTVNLFNTFASRTFTQTLSKVHKDAVNMSRDINFNATPPEPTNPLLIDVMSSESLALRENLNKSLAEIEELKKEKEKMDADMSFLQRDYDSLKKRMDPIFEEVKTLRYQKTDLEKQCEDMKEENKEAQQRCIELERKVVNRARLVQTLKNQLEEKEEIIASNLNNSATDRAVNIKSPKYTMTPDIVQNSRIEEELEQYRERVSQLEDQLQKNKDELAKVKGEAKAMREGSDYYNTPPTSPPLKDIERSKRVYSLSEILESNRYIREESPEDLSRRVYWLCECLTHYQDALNNSENSMSGKDIQFPPPPSSIKMTDGLNGNDSEKQIISNLMAERDDTLNKQHQLEKELLDLQNRYNTLSKKHEDLLINHSNVIDEGKKADSIKQEQTNNTIKLLQQQFKESSMEMNQQLEEKSLMIEKFSLMLEDKDKSLTQSNRSIREKDKKINELNRQLEALQKEKNREIESLKSTIRNLTSEKDDLKKVNYQRQSELESVKNDLRKEQIRQREANINTSMSDSSSTGSNGYERRSGRVSASSPTHNNAQIMERISKMRSEVDAMRKKLRNKSTNEFSI
ncbi:calponin homology domain-containing protein [Neocallimastix lanati (nom. inval.)]|jgi:uncharacterized coiled-coil DUF342 family protein|uniref:Calponin-homology (CH) domain-containing protein n=1 Tax=Neocallimastix californiae TaxID=1754190 RepID=A0A1Y2A2W7_9FUNG|nr:calponin homology domain-containing protein [Neocallimastix sp. JGI-2020a]ORY16846.1 hypothetical protein LY90DRAFT_677387 [Neocallimastix californiae]|eukprot:ORY16846.1 hypothetical protein LY90DRAFT_677387 [Neocallimastix californiae]